MITNVREYLAARLGVQAVPRVGATGLTLGIAASTVLRQNPRRLGFHFVNLSVNDMYLTPIGVPTTIYGVRVGPSGGSLFVSAEEDGEVVAWAWQGIANAAGSQYYVMEDILDFAEEEVRGA